jgi:hypothetical protein
MAHDHLGTVRSGQFAVPLTIGATGHRDISPEDVPRLADAIAGVLTELRAACPDTPFVVISPLAEGADQLVARVAIERFDAKMIVPLPFDRGSYETDFTSDATRAEFAILLGRSWRSFTMGSPAGGANDHPSGLARDDAYRRVGLWTAQHAHVLIALWNGEEATSDAGTAGTVRARLAGHVTASDPAPLDQAELGMIVQVITPRASKRETIGPAFAVRRLWPPHAAPSPTIAEASHRRVLGAVAALNRQAIGSGIDAATWVERGRSQIGAALQAEAGRFSWLPALMALCDATSVKFGQRLRRALVLLIVVAFVGVGFAQAALATGIGVLAVGLWSSMVIGYAIWAFTRLRGWEAKHLDWRALGEACRVQIYWRIAGLRAPVADSYLTTQAGDLDLVRRMVRTADMLDELAMPLATPESEAADRDRIGRVVDAWLDEQVRYCIGAGNPAKDGAAGRCATITRRCRSAIYACLALAIAVPTAGWTASMLAPGAMHFDATALAVTLNVTLAVVAAIGTFQSFMAPGDLARWYANCGLALQRAGRACRAALVAGRLDDAQRVLRDAGRVSLAENAAWLILRRQRPLPPR